MDTNIVKLDNTIPVPESLTKDEQKKLKAMVTGYRKMKIAQKATGLDRITIYKAMAGMNVRHTTSAKIRAFLSGQAETKNS